MVGILSGLGEDLAEKLDWKLTFAGRKLWEYGVDLKGWGCGALGFDIIPWLPQTSVFKIP